MTVVALSATKFTPNGPSIQANLDAALIKMAKCPEGVTIPTVASGRTDSGVHALGQVVHFDYPAPMPQQAMQRALNALLARRLR